MIGIPDERLGEIAVAIVDPKPGEIITEIEIIDFCNRVSQDIRYPGRSFSTRCRGIPRAKLKNPS